MRHDLQLQQFRLWLVPTIRARSEAWVCGLWMLGLVQSPRTNNSFNISLYEGALIHIYFYPFQYLKLLFTQVHWLAANDVSNSCAFVRFNQKINQLKYCHRMSLGWEHINCSGPHASKLLNSNHTMTLLGRPVVMADKSINSNSSSPLVSVCSNWTRFIYAIQ